MMAFSIHFALLLSIFTFEFVVSQYRQPFNNTQNLQQQYYGQQPIASSVERNQQQQQQLYSSTSSLSSSQSAAAYYGQQHWPSAAQQYAGTSAAAAGYGIPDYQQQKMAQQQSGWRGSVPTNVNSNVPYTQSLSPYAQQQQHTPAGYGSTTDYGGHAADYGAQQQQHTQQYGDSAGLPYTSNSFEGLLNNNNNLQQHQQRFGQVLNMLDNWTRNQMSMNLNLSLDLRNESESSSSVRHQFGDANMVDNPHNIDNKNRIGIVFPASSTSQHQQPSSSSYWSSSAPSTGGVHHQQLLLLLLLLALVGRLSPFAL